METFFFLNEVSGLLSQTVKVWANCKNGLASKIKVNISKHKTETGSGHTLLCDTLRIFIVAKINPPTLYLPTHSMIFPFLLRKDNENKEVSEYEKGRDKDHSYCPFPHSN